MNDLAEIMERRGSLSLAHQVIYLCNVLSLLRERPDDAARLLRDPIALRDAYIARFETDLLGVPIDPDECLPIG